MKETKIKGKQQNNYKKYFNDPSGWCPFFGFLPVIPIEYDYQDSIVFRCIEIIHKARVICNVPGWPADSASPNADEMEEQTGFPKAKILLARAVLSRSETIIYNARCYSIEAIDHNIYFDTSVQSNLKVGADQVAIDALRHEISVTKGKIDIDIYDIEDYEMFSMIAISEAWYILEDILYYKENSNDISKLRDLLDVELLLSRAVKLKLIPDAIRGRKNRTGGKKGIKDRWSKPDAKASANKLIAFVEDKASIIEKNNRNITPTGIARKISNDYKIPFETVRKTPAIINRIKLKKQK